MKRIFLLLHAALALSAYSARAQSGVSERQLLYDDSVSPVHGLNWAPQPPAVLPNLPGAQPGQFRGAIVYGGITRPGVKNPSLAPGTFADNVDKGHMDWPRSEKAGEVKSILRAAVGGPYLNHGFDYLFGQVIVPPVTDFAGIKLTPAQADFWHPVPVFRQVLAGGSVTNDPSKATDYYYSPHKQAVYATKAGQVAIAWRAASSTIATAPTGYNEGVTHVRIGPFFYPVTNSLVSVSGIPFKPPQTLYWTKGDYEKSGQLVAVPPTVHVVNFVYNNSIPETVPEDEVVVGGNINGNASVFTSTVRAENGFISAYNREGRIFLELLGDATGPSTRQQLGVEIIEVQRDAVAIDMTIELGERVTAYPDNDPPDSALQPAPINQVGKNLVFKRSLGGGGGAELFATHVTKEGDEFEAFWLKPSVGGLAWPYRFVRYAFVWPTNVAAYSHYIRPQVANEAAAALTAIPLPGENAPILEEQDPSNIGTARAKLTTSAQFYTFLDPSQPTLRALLRYNVGDRVAFERVFSWLDANIKSTNIDNAVAGGLSEVAAYQAAKSRDVNGSWTLRVGKLSGAETGKIDSWTLVVETRSASGEAGETEFTGSNINIPATGEVASQVVVSGVTDTVTAIRLKVDGFTFPNPARLFMTLGNATTSLDLIRGVGGSGAVASVSFAFADSAPAAVTSSIIAKDYLPAGGTLSSLLSPVPVFAWTDTLVSPRLHNAIAYVGERIEPPAGELGTLGDAYPGGYINQSAGTAFSATAYANPFRGGYEVAHRSSIIPVNAIPGQNQLEVWWFRKHAPTALRDETLGFKATYWPAVIGRYTLAWPPNPEHPEKTTPIVLASNHGSGPLNSFQAAGALYIQNDRLLPGYNPNEEHALLQGGRVWALRDDLNVTNGVNYSSHPYVLLEYADQDGRPSMTAFPVLRQTATEKFDYPVDAGLVLQAPMPLPLLEKPIAPTAPGELPRSLNAEVARRNVAGLEFPSAAGTDISVNVSVTDSPLFLAYQSLLLQQKTSGDRFWLYTTNINLELNQINGVLSRKPPVAFKTGATLVQSAVLKVIRYPFSSAAVLPNSGKAVVANPDAGKSWVVNVLGVAPALIDGAGAVIQPAFIEVEFPNVAGAEVDAQNDPERAEATVLVPEPIAKNDLPAATVQQFAADWQVAYENLVTVATGLAQERRAQAEFYNQITFQDRKGDLWIYRGPHGEDDAATRQIQFYYKTLPGFWYPTDQAGKVLGTNPALNQQPDVGTVTPYLRAVSQAGDQYLGDAVYGNRNQKVDESGHLVGDGNALGVVYRARWPETAPVLQMAETLTVPKRGLPAVRGQTSMEVLYQQSLYTNAANPSVALHDPTAAKKFRLAGTNPDGSSSGGLNKLPGSIQTSPLRGKTYFPRLAPHLVDRFYFDPNDSKSGSLVFIGQFKNEVLGESYLLPNVISGDDILALKALCAADDALKTDWDNAIDNASGKPSLTAELETFYPNPAKPGTFTSTISIGGQAVRQMVPVHANELAEIKHSDTAVDSYALTAIGPGTGYVTLIAGQGAAFTPPDEPVSVKIIKVSDTLYRGEVKVILSSNPLAEKVTMQQVVDLAGKVENFDFEWWIAAPVSGAPPPVYGNTATNLVFPGGDTWRHISHPLAADTPPVFGTVGALANSSRVATNASTLVAPVSLISFDSVTEAADGILNFKLPPTPATTLANGNNLIVRDRNGVEIPALVKAVQDGTVSVAASASATKLPAAVDVRQLFESVSTGKPQSVLFRDFSVSAASTYSQYYLSLDLDDALGAKVYVDGALVVTVNLGEDDTSTITPPGGFSPAPLAKAYGLSPASFAGGAASGPNITHRIAVELFSGAIPGASLQFRCQLDAYESVDKVDATGSKWTKLDADRFPDKVRTILGQAADVRALSDNYVVMRYKAKTTANFPAESKRFSLWTDPALAEGWIKRVLAGINPFNQRTTDLFNQTVNTDASILTSAGKRWEGDVALNLDSINDYGLIEIYETVLRRGKDLSINAGISYDPANDALLLAAGYLNDLYMMVGNEARADSSNPTIGIGTKDKTYGDIATALFSFKGQLPTLLEEELTLLRGRDDFLQPGTQLAPVYNRLVWNYTRGIDSGEVIYALNYNILDQNNDGKVDAADAAKLFPQGHGDAYGHYLTAMKGYYSLLIDKDFAWVPHAEAVNILGKAVAVDYQDERKFAAAAAAVARTGRQVFELTWRRDVQPGIETGWGKFTESRDNVAQVPPTHRYWGLDHWAARTGLGAYINWAVGNSILPPTDPDPSHEGIQKVDRTTVPELREIAITAADLQTAMDNAEGRATPLGLAAGGLAFDINPNQVTGTDPKPHFEQVYERALGALNNAVAGFDDAKDVTRLMRSEQDSLAELQAAVLKQEQAYTNSLIELYGTPYPDDVGPGKLYKDGYSGPDLYHYTYVETETIEAPGVYTPNQPDYVAKIDIQQLAGSWSYLSNLPRTNVNTHGLPDGSSDDLVIVNANDPLYQTIDPGTGKPMYYIPYAFGSHGFFDKPAAWTSKRQSPGRIQQAISELIQAHDRMYYALAAQCESDKQDLDKAVQVFQSLENAYSTGGSIRGDEQADIDAQKTMADLETGFEITDKVLENLSGLAADTLQFVEAAIPNTLIFGFAAGGDVVRPAPAAALYATAFNVKQVLDGLRTAGFMATKISSLAQFKESLDEGQTAVDAERAEAMKAAVSDLGSRLKAVQGDFQVINEKLRIFDDTKRKYAAVVAEGERLLQEREIFRQRSAAIIQGFRTRDAAFRIFRNEKLERYNTLFDLAARYAYLAANAYDYETGLLATSKGKAFLNRIVSSRALGLVKDGKPQFAGSGTGDPGISSALAEMKADWDVLKGRLGFNNPTSYGTTFSLRTEKHRILPGAEGATAWKDVLNNALKANLLEDADVKRFCMQIDRGDGLPLPGLIIEFETTVADGYNFFGQTQQAWDHYFDSSSFATKIFAAGVALEGYVGMDNPAANSGAIGGAGGSSPADPNLAFLDPNALGATPGIYLIPVGLDSMRSPALGDRGTIRTWSVDDVSIPLPFNIGASDFSTKAIYQSGDSLSEPLFEIRKHAAFRPVSTTAAFSSAIYGNNGSLQRSQFTNTRLIGRSVWNSKWKLVIPGSKLLHDPDEGLRRFINTVTDVKLHLVTYSYSGN